MPAEGWVSLRAALWLLGLCAVLAPVQCSPDRPSWRYISTEVVIPRKELHQGKGAQVLGWLSYSRFGFCRRISWSINFIGCSLRDLLCGRLQCTNVSFLPLLQEHVGFHQTHQSEALCFGLDLHRGQGAVDYGHVRDGSLCAPGTYCLNTFCNGSVSEMEYTCFPQKCNSRGVCNSEDNCHCHLGWAPPFCQNTGDGGSEDSGPPPRLFRSVPYDETILVYVSLVFGRLYALIAAVLFGVATNVKTIHTSKIKEETVHPV